MSLHVFIFSRTVYSAIQDSRLPIGAHCRIIISQTPFQISFQSSTSYLTFLNISSQLSRQVAIQVHPRLFFPIPFQIAQAISHLCAKTTVKDPQLFAFKVSCDTPPKVSSKLLCNVACFRLPYNFTKIPSPILSQVSQFLRKVFQYVWVQLPCSSHILLFKLHCSCQWLKSTCCFQLQFILKICCIILSQLKSLLGISNGHDSCSILWCPNYHCCDILQGGKLYAKPWRARRWISWSHCGTRKEAYNFWGQCFSTSLTSCLHSNK